MDHYNGVLTNAGITSKELWDTEGSWGSHPLATEEEDAAYLVRRFLLERSKGVARFYWEAWDATGNWGTMWSAATGVNPVGQAYAQVNKWMAGATLSPCTQATNGTYTCSLTRSNYQGLVVWNPNTSMSYTPGTEFTTHRNMYGTASNITGPVTIGSDPILLETPASGNIPPQAVLNVDVRRNQHNLFFGAFRLRSVHCDRRFVRIVCLERYDLFPDDRFRRRHRDYFGIRNPHLSHRRQLHSYAYAER